MCNLSSDLFFLGSRVGDSLLIYYTEKNSLTILDNISHSADFENIVNFL